MDNLELSDLALRLAEIVTDEVGKAEKENPDNYEALDGDMTEFIAQRFLIELDKLQGNK